MSSTKNNISTTNTSPNVAQRQRILELINDHKFKYQELVVQILNNAIDKVHITRKMSINAKNYIDLIIKAMTLSNSIKKITLDSIHFTTASAGDLESILKMNNIFSLKILNVSNINSRMWIYRLCSGLSKNTSLTKLTIRRCHILDKGCDCILKALNGHQAIKTLNLIYCSMSDVCTNNLSLPVNLEYLDLSNNKIRSAPRIYSILNTITGHANLKTIILDDNELSTDAIDQFCILLISNNSISDLYIQKNNLVYNDIVKIMDVVKYKEIKVLNIGYQYLDTNAVKYICDVLAEHKYITDIGLFNAGISSNDMKYIVENFIGKNLNIVVLGLCGNEIDDDCAEIIIDKLKNNDTLIYLTLPCCYISQSLLDIIIHRLVDNSRKYDLMSMSMTALLLADNNI